MNCRHCDIELTEHDMHYGKIDECQECASDIERYVGHMIWDHKTAPALEVHANARSLAALHDGRYNAGELVHEVKERGRRRESDVSGGSQVSLTPYRRSDLIIHREVEPLPVIQLRQGSGKTVATYNKNSLKKVASGSFEVLHSIKNADVKLIKAASHLNLSRIDGSFVTILRDEAGYYVIPKRSLSNSKQYTRYSSASFRSSLDHETIRQVGYRTANYNPI